VKKLLLVLALLAPGCSSTLAPSGTLTGTWVAQASVVGSRLSWTLKQVGTAVNGTGQYALEAGRSGTLMVTGTYRPPTVTLDLQYDYGLKDTFAGTLIDANHLNGTLGSAGSPLTLARQ
jgi:hypothetical protein